MLTLLEEKGGKEGQALVKAFREADVASACPRGSGQCYEVKDQITITIDNGGGGGGYSGGLNFSLSKDLFNDANETDSLVHAGQLGHEIVHLTQDDPLDRLLGQHSGSLYNEIDAYDVQSKIYENMGLTKVSHGTVEYAAEAASLKDKSPKEILSSRWARAQDQYDGFPLRSGGNRRFDDWRYLK